MIEALKVEPVSGHIGAEISGVDLASDVDAAVLDDLRALLDRHLVLFLRGQNLTIERQKWLTRAFGPLYILPYVTPLDDHPEVIAVKKKADERGGVFGGNWHSDFSFLPDPPAGSVLNAITIPPFGGDTLWANQIRAYERLPNNLKALLDGRDAIHTGAPYGAKHAPPPSTRAGHSMKMARGDPAADREQAHPAVRTDPRTGRQSLNINPIYTVRLDGLSEKESRPYLQATYACAVRPEFTCRHRWRPGDLVIWDNTTTLHYAINDYDGHDRLLYRTAFGRWH